MKRCALVGLLLCASLVSLLAQDAPISLPAESGPSSPIYATELVRCLAISQRLAAISQELTAKLLLSEQTSVTLQGELSELRNELATQSSELAELRAKLQASGTRSAELEALLAKAEGSLESLQQSWTAYKAEAEAQIRRSSREAEIWRSAALAAAGGLAGALAGPAVGEKELPSAGAGAALGVVGGLVWYLVEHWPPWSK
jgi:Skp family chaperone for outer membrane proteins